MVDLSVKRAYGLVWFGSGLGFNIYYKNKQNKSKKRQRNHSFNDMSFKINKIFINNSFV